MSLLGGPTFDWKSLLWAQNLFYPLSQGWPGWPSLGVPSMRYFNGWYLHEGLFEGLEHHSAWWMAVQKGSGINLPVPTNPTALHQLLLRPCGHWWVAFEVGISQGSQNFLRALALASHRVDLITHPLFPAPVHCLYSLSPSWCSLYLLSKPALQVFSECASGGT